MGSLSIQIWKPKAWKGQVPCPISHNWKCDRATTSNSRTCALSYLWHNSALMTLTCTIQGQSTPKRLPSSDFPSRTAHKTSFPWCSAPVEDISHSRTSHWSFPLVVQWLRIHLPMQETWVQSLVQGDSTCLQEAKPMCHNYREHALEPTCSRFWAHRPKPLKAQVPRVQAQQQVKPLQRDAHSPHLESSPHSPHAATTTQHSKQQGDKFLK